MKIAFYMENKSEKSMLDALHEKDRVLSVRKGSFYECRGGWIRHKYGQFDGPYTGSAHGNEDDSTMLVMHMAEKAAPDPDPEQEQQP